MSKDEARTERKDGADGEDIQWFENYEKHGKSGEHSDSLKKEDILNYIKDIERNCHLEMNSGDEDYADTKRSSNCSARCPRARFRSSKSRSLRSRPTSRRNKSANSVRRKVKSNPLNARDTRSYSRSSQTPRFSGNADLAVNSTDFRENLNTARSAYSNKRGSYNHQESSPRFYGWYSRKDRKMWPMMTKMTSFEIVTDRSGTFNRQISSSNISERRSLLPNGFEFPRNEMELNASIHSNIAPNEKARVKNLPRKNHRKIRCSSRCNDQGDAGGFANQRRVDEFRIDRDAYSADLLHRNSRNSSCASGYRYPVRESAQPPSSSRNCLCNKLTRPRLTEMRSRRRALRRRDEEEVSVEATGSITGWIDGAYRESWHRNNTDQWRREPCCREPDFLRESERLRKVAHDPRDKLSLGLEDAELDERAMDRSAPKKVYRYDSWLEERETLGEILYKSRQSWNDHEEPLDFDLPIGECLRRKDACDEISMFDGIIFNGRVHDYDDGAQDLEGSEPLLSDDCMSYTYTNARKYEECATSCDLENNQAKTLRERARRLPVDKEFSPETRTQLRDRRKPPCDTVESACECRELFFRPPATCLAVGFCSCSEDNDNSRRKDDNDDDDSARQVTSEGPCCYYCYCSSCCYDRSKSNQSFHGKADRSTLREPLRSSCAMRSDAQHRRVRREINERDESGSGSEEAAIGREWPMNPTVRLGRPRHDRSKTNLNRILIYPPRGQVGPPLTLYKGSSNINCRVKGDADTGFRYSVTYVQKFVSPTWMPGAPPEVETEGCEEYECSADHG